MAKAAAATAKVRPSARVNPGTQREYEMILILRPDMLQDDIMSVNNRLKETIDKGGGRMLLLENWGKRRLAYEIKKQLKGIYLYWQYLGDSRLAHEIERTARMIESIIRVFTIKLDENIDPAARPGEVTDAEFQAASATRPDEEELATGYLMTGTGEKIPVSKLTAKDEEAEGEGGETKTTAADETAESKPAEAPASSEATDADDAEQAEKKEASDEEKA